MDIHLIYTAIFYLFCAAAFFQIFYMLFFYLRLANFKGKQIRQENYPPVSIIICAKNEDANLKQNLPKILAQDYPNFEVIVVDDNSEDGTTEYLFFLAQKEPRLKAKCMDTERKKKLCWATEHTKNNRVI